MFFQRDFFEDDVVEEEEEFEPIDVGTLDDINEATAELLRKSRELTMTVGVYGQRVIPINN